MDPDTLRPHQVAPRPIGELAALLGLPAPAGNGGRVPVTGVTHDSRQVRPGDLYAALPGARFHGADFCAQAAAAGAAAVLASPDGAERALATGLPVLVVDDPRASLGTVAGWVYGQPTDRLRTIGITGTNGKTTCAYFVEAGLRAAGHTTGLIGTVQTSIAGSVVNSVRTTPEITDLQALFATAVERGVSALAMEVSSHALVLHRVDGIRFDVAVFTNLSQDHLDFHTDLDDYFEAKALLFTAERARAAVVNLDDPYGRRLAERAAVPTATYSATGAPEADWRAVDVRLGQSGSHFEVHGPSGLRLAAEVRLPGEYNVANALASIVALATAGVDPAEAVRGVADLGDVPGRMERVEAGQPFLAVVDYAHTPDAVENVLRSLRQVTKGSLYVVVGCGGDRDREKRPLMGEAAARLADVAVFTNDNPRSEDPLTILAAMAAGAETVEAAARAETLVEPDRAQAIAIAVRRAAAGDTVVVAGKGHEQGQDVGGVVRPFDDRVALRVAVEQVLVPAGAPQTPHSMESPQ